MHIAQEPREIRVSSLKIYSGNFNIFKPNLEPRLIELGRSETISHSNEFEVENLDGAVLQLALSELSNNYVAGFILKKIKKKVMHCEQCKDEMFGASHDENNALIKSREYGGGWNQRLCYPSHRFAVYFYETQQFIHNYLKDAPSNMLLKIDLQNGMLNRDVKLIPACQNHQNDVRLFVNSMCIRTLVHAWCHQINLIFCGKNTVRPVNSCPTTI